MVKKLSIVLFALACLVVAVFIALTKPYMEYGYGRVDNQPVTIEVEYINVTGDPLCTKLYKVINGEVSDEGIFPNIPSDIPDPHDVAELTDGDRLSLTGYLYEWQEKNLITGNTQHRSVNQIDVISWQQGNHLVYKSSLKGISGSQFSKRNYTDCRP